MEIDCTACSSTALARREPVFDGLRKIGEQIVCMSCGHRHDADALDVSMKDGKDGAPSSTNALAALLGGTVPERRPVVFDESDRPTPPSVFDDSDRPVRPNVFAPSERRRCCGWCRHFVLNPFSQRCGLNNRAVEATDVCDAFDAKADN